MKSIQSNLLRTDFVNKTIMIQLFEQLNKNALTHYILPEFYLLSGKESCKE